MTLSIALITPRICAVATDRRITDAQGRVRSEETDKTCVLWTDDAKMAVSFSGLAGFGRFSTHDWVLNALSECSPPDFTISGLVRRFTGKASQRFKKISLSARDKRLSVLMAGYLFRQNKYLPIYAVVSNFERPDVRIAPAAAASEEFIASCGSLQPDGKQSCVSVAIGDVRHLSANRIIDLRASASKLKPNAIRQRLVHAIRHAAFGGQPLSTIGSQISTVVIEPDPGSSVWSQYHSAVVQRNMHVPAMVWAKRDSQIAISNIKLAAADRATIIVPPVGANKLCPCGSGKRYKACHGLRK